MDNDWTLTPQQKAYMDEHTAEIEAAYANEDMATLNRLYGSMRYRMAFGDMSWDEAYDRYEETRWDETLSSPKSDAFLDQLANEIEIEWAKKIHRKNDPPEMKHDF